MGQGLGRAVSTVDESVVGELVDSALFYFIAVLGFCIAIGLFYRLSMALLWLCFTYVFLLDQAQYLVIAGLGDAGVEHGDVGARRQRAEPARRVRLGRVRAGIAQPPEAQELRADGQQRSRLQLAACVTDVVPATDLPLS